MNTENSTPACPCCGASTRIVDEGKEQLLACTACDWRQWPVPPLRETLKPVAFLPWLAVGLLPILTPMILNEIRGDRQLLGISVLLGSAVCCLFGGFGLASLMGGGQVRRLILGLGASVALAIVCLVVGAFGTCALGPMLQ